MFKWVIQEDFTNKGEFEMLLDSLERQSVEFHFVKTIPFTRELIPNLELDGNVFACGGTTLSDIAKNKGWIYFDENLDSEILLQNYGDMLLNSDMVICKLSDVPERPSFFIRPCLDRKQFTGQVMDWFSFVNWRNQIKHLVEHGDYTTLTLQERVAVSSVTKIFSEYRFFVVDGELITWSLYKRGNTVFSSPYVEQPVIDYAKLAVEKWCPNRAFVIDIADTPKGYRIIECNSINSSGFYKIDIGKFIYAINSMTI